MSLHRTIALSTRRLLTGPALALLLSATAANASVIVEEQFIYPTGTPLPGMSLGTGWAAPWVGSLQMTAFSPSLQHPSGIAPAGDSIYNSNVGEAFRPFVGGGIHNLAHDLWISFMEQSNAGLTAAEVAFTPPDSTFPDITIDKIAGGAVFLRSSFAGSTLAGFSSGIGSTDLFVIHIGQLSGVTSKVDLFLNPTIAGGFTVPSASFTLITPLGVELEQLYYRSDAQEQFDEIHIGSAPTDVSAVPTPGALAIAGSGALLLLRRRRAR